jgi:hypothetical protein
MLYGVLGGIRARPSGARVSLYGNTSTFPAPRCIRNGPRVRNEPIWLEFKSVLHAFKVLARLDLDDGIGVGGPPRRRCVQEQFRHQRADETVGNVRMLESID